MILLQARTTSTRLPAKVLLPVAGMPIVVLAAMRAANSGRDVLVVTSVEPSDDLLVNVLADYQVPYFRGELNNVLKRFVDSTRNLRSDAVVVRLTADNVFPDGQFIDRIINVFQESKLDYLDSGSPESGLPYGMSAEITRTGLLREALANTSAPDDLEHVTPYIRRHYGKQAYLELADLKLSKYRCTIDTLDDYLKVAKIFRMVDDPVNVSSHRLFECLVETC